MKKIYLFLIALLYGVMLLQAAPTMGLVFSGASTSFIDVGTTATAPAEFTIEAWVYYQSFPSGESAYLLSTEVQAAAGSQGFALRANGNKLQLAVGTNTAWVKVTGSTSLSLNTWYHVAATCSGTEIKLYVNGVLDGTASTAVVIPSTTNLRIGDSPSWSGRLFNGMMADLRFWNVVRSAAEISANMNSSLSGTETGILANWKMDEGTGTTVADVKATYPITRPTDVNWYSLVTGISISGATNYISELAGTTQITATIIPSNASQSLNWSVSDPTIATISSTGLLTAKNNGTVTLTATSNDGSNISSNSIQIQISNQPTIAPAKQILVDFGPATQATLSKLTVSPDANSNYWNNFVNNTASSAAVALIDKTNTATGISIKTLVDFSVNATPGAPGLEPTNASALGDLSIPSATLDYFFTTTTTPSLKFTGLSANKAYKFSVFGCRISSTDTRVSKYTFTGAATTVGTLQTSGLNLGGVGVHANNSSLYITPAISADANGEIKLELYSQTGGFAYINALKIEEFSTEKMNVTGITVTGEDITITGASSQMKAEISPVNATIPSVTWTVSDPTKATIDVNGLLRPLKDGIITVTATTKEAGSTISGSKQITISNQHLSLYFSGSATENGNTISTAIPMYLLTDLQGNSNGVFELYTNLNSTGTFNFYTSQSGNATVYGAGVSTGTILSAGPAIDPTVEGPVLITVDMTAKTYTILPITKMGVIGANGEVALNYKGKGVWSSNVNMADVLTDANKNFSFRANSSSTYAIKRIKGTSTNEVKMESQAIASNIAVEEIGLIDKGYYTINLDMNQYNYSVVDSMKITIMGSSVPTGAGATNNHGYIYLYDQLLDQRYTQSNGANWNLVNMSIGGNSTIDVTGRVDRDLYPQYGRYVVFALSLGNEGIHGSTNQQGIFDQWKNNMLSLIAAARAKGLVPIVTNNYTRSDFNASDYSYIKKIDLLIHEWDVPSVNLLGAIDDGAGRWATGYRYDDAHPNDAGHAEFSYAMVPSLFDALRAGKQLPVKASDNSMTFNNESSIDQLVYTPDNIIHSFTVSFDIKTTANGTIASFKQGQTFGILKIDAATGAIVYQSPKTGEAQIKGISVVNDGQWHKITLTHFYARGETDLYSDNTLAGKLTEKLVPTEFYLNDWNSPASISFRDLFFYRAGMNKEEVAGMNAGKMLKSSLELYAPLNGLATTSEDQLMNMAQSTTTLTKVHVSTSGTKVPTQFSNVKVYPNPAVDKLTINGLDQDSQYECEVYGPDGRISLQQNIYSGDVLNVDSLAKSYYVMVLKDKKSTEQITLSFIKY